MRAAVYYGPNELEIDDVAEPEPTAGTVKLKVAFNGICGTDLHEYYAGPIFVPTHRPPAENPHPRVHFVADGIKACVERAKEAAGDRDVMLHGADTAQSCLKAGVLDVLEIQLRPVLLGQGRRLFDAMPPEHIELELVRTLEAPGVLHLRYDLRHP